MGSLTYVLVAAVIALGAGGGYFLLRARRGSAKEEYEHFNCPSCRQRLRYYPRQAGRTGECPRCHKPITFPGTLKSPGDPRR